MVVLNASMCTHIIYNFIYVTLNHLRTLMRVIASDLFNAHSTLFIFLASYTYSFHFIIQLRLPMSLCCQDIINIQKLRVSKIKIFFNYLYVDRLFAFSRREKLTIKSCKPERAIDEERMTSAV